MSLVSVYDLELKPQLAWALWAGWKPTVTLDNLVVWSGKAGSHRDAARDAQQAINRFLLVRPRCNGQGCTSEPVLVDVQTLLEDGFDGTSWYCSAECWSAVMRERF